MAKYGDKVLESEELDIFVRMVMSRVHGLLEILDFVVKFSELGLRIDKDTLSQDIMPKIIDAGSVKGKSVMPLLWTIRNRLVSNHKEPRIQCGRRAVSANEDSGNSSSFNFNFTVRTG